MAATILLVALAISLFGLIKTSRLDATLLYLILAIIAAHRLYFEWSPYWRYRFSSPSDDIVIAHSFALAGLILAVALTLDNVLRRGFYRKYIEVPNFRRRGNSLISYVGLIASAALVAYGMANVGNVFSASFDIYEISRISVLEYIPVLIAATYYFWPGEVSGYTRRLFSVVILGASVVFLLGSLRLVAAPMMLLCFAIWFEGRCIKKSWFIAIFLGSFTLYSLFGLYRFGAYGIDVKSALLFLGGDGNLDNNFTGSIETGYMYSVFTLGDLGNASRLLVQSIWPLTMGLLPSDWSITTRLSELGRVPGGGSIESFIGNTYFVLLFPIVALFRIVAHDASASFNSFVGICLLISIPRFALYSPQLPFKYLMFALVLYAVHSVLRAAFRSN